MAKHIQLAKKGENIALEYLVNQGHQILETNWRFNQFEIDIISKSNNILVFTEVKARTGSDYGKPEDAVTTSKQRYLGKAADEYIYSKEYDGDIRFDIISIEFLRTNYDILHLEDAFFPIG